MNIGAGSIPYIPKALSNELSGNSWFSCCRGSAMSGTKGSLAHLETRSVSGAPEIREANFLVCSEIALRFPTR